MNTYRPDIDGLRAIAVLGVVIFHSGLGVSGGFAGVDVFFVISGYLITRIILRDLEEGRFSMLRFWERRARRILPALTLTVVLTLVAGWFLLFPQGFQQLGRSVVALAFFGSNVNFWLEDNYFGDASESKPLLHTWSLSVEEQFYLIIPLVLWSLYQLFRGRGVTTALWFGFLASLGLSVWATQQIQYVSASFFLLPTRAWELLAGSLVVVAPPVQNLILRQGMASVGLAAVISAFVLFSPETPFPGHAALVPVIGTALLIWSGRGTDRMPQPLVFRLLARRPLVFIGLISYSLYLIHWPLFAFHHVIFGRPPDTVVACSMIVISIALAIISWRYVETPFRNNSLVSTRRGVMIASTASIAVLMVLGGVILKNGGFEKRFSPEVIQIVSGSGAKRVLPSRNMRITDVPEGLIRFGRKDAPERIFLWGDSHADAVMPGVEAACIQAGVAGHAATSWVTPPVKNWFKPNRHGQNQLTAAYNQAVFEHIRSESLTNDPLTVVLAGNWNYYLEEADDRVPFAKALEAQIADLVSVGCRVIILRQFPLYPDHVPRNLAMKMHFDMGVFDIAMTKDDYLNQREPQDEAFAQVAERFPDLLFLDPLEAFVGADGVMMQTDSSGHPLYLDHGHISPEGSLRIAERLAQLIKIAEGKSE